MDSIRVGRLFGKSKVKVSLQLSKGISFRGCENKVRYPLRFFKQVVGESGLL